MKQQVPVYSEVQCHLKKLHFTKKQTSEVLFSCPEIAPQGKNKLETQKENAQRASGIGTSYTNAPFQNTKKVFFLAGETFETSRNSSESQRRLPRQGTQH